MASEDGCKRFAGLLVTQKLNIGAYNGPADAGPGLPSPHGHQLSTVSSLGQTVQGAEEEPSKPLPSPVKPKAQAGARVQRAGKVFRSTVNFAEQNRQLQQVSRIELALSSQGWKL